MKSYSPVSTVMVVLLTLASSNRLHGQQQRRSQPFAASRDHHRSLLTSTHSGTRSWSITSDCKRNNIVERIRGGSDYGGDSASSFPRRPGDDRYGRSSSSEHAYSNDYYESSQAPPSPYREPWEEDPADRYYEDYERDATYGDRRPQRRSEPLSLLPAIFRTGDKRIGLMLLGAGTVVTMLGMSLFFNKTLMRLGNLLFIAGVPLTLGPTKVVGYFWQPQKARATACLGVGIFLVFLGWPVFGMALEVFGLLNLFGNLFPVVLAVAKQMPIVGSILSVGTNNNNNNSGRNTKDGRRERYYEEDDDYYYQGRSDRTGRRRDDGDQYY